MFQRFSVAAAKAGDSSELVAAKAAPQNVRRNHKSAHDFAQTFMQDLRESLEIDFPAHEVPLPHEVRNLYHDAVLHRLAPLAPGSKPAKALEAATSTISAEELVVAAAKGGDGAAGKAAGDGKEDEDEDEFSADDGRGLGVEQMQVLTTYAVGERSMRASNLDKPLAVVGPPGSGKSALLAAWVSTGIQSRFGPRRTRESMAATHSRRASRVHRNSVQARHKERHSGFPLTFVSSAVTTSKIEGRLWKTVFISGVVSPSTETRLCAVLRRIMAEIKDHCEVEELVPHHDADILPTFRRWLGGSGGPDSLGAAQQARMRLVVVVDGLDHLTEVAPPPKDQRLMGGKHSGEG
eukprot:g4016.t1